MNTPETDTHHPCSHRWIEACLLTVCLGMGVLLMRTADYKIVVLNLFFLPVVLGGFFLGRYRAGILALFSVITASVIAFQNLNHFGTFNSPLVVGMGLAVWAAVLGLTAIIVGTLSDERTTKLVELHEAYVGVVEVLTRYLQSANPVLKDRAEEFASLCEQVAIQLKLSNREVDDIRVAALLYDMENIQVTAKVIKKAVVGMEESPDGHEHTFNGTELMMSLSRVLTGAFPLLVDQNDVLAQVAKPLPETAEIPFGTLIIRSVRGYHELVHGTANVLGQPLDSQSALEELKLDGEPTHHPTVLQALETVLERKAERTISSEAEQLILETTGSV